MPPTIILLPGMDGTGDLFEPLVSDLGSELQTIIVSYSTDQELDYLALATLARASLPQNEPFVLIAESFSGPVAIKLAVGKPKGLVGLIFCPLSLAIRDRYL